MKYHQYEIETRWTGNVASGTSGYRSYRRDHEMQAAGKPVIPGSSDPTFRGDAMRYNPEDLLVASVSACHMLWYLHLCADAGIVVTAYIDHAAGTMSEHQDGSGEFTNVTLRPTVVLDDDSRLELAHRLHADVHRYCFIARSVNFPITVEPSITARPTV
jgi:organic hydroperoxide reductase OsmC/OhrA